MEKIAGGKADHYYGKADVAVYRLNRDGHAPNGHSPVFGASVKMLAPMLLIFAAILLLIVTPMALQIQNSFGAD